MIKYSVGNKSRWNNNNNKTMVLLNTKCIRQTKKEKGVNNHVRLCSTLFASRLVLEYSADEMFCFYKVNGER